MKRVAAVIVTFNPEKEHIKNIEKISKYVEKVFLVDNTEGKVDFNLPLNVEIIKNEKNLGIASGFNIGIKLSVKEGFDLLFLFDQDSKISEDFVKQMVDFSTLNKDVFLFAPKVFDYNANVYLNYLKLNKFSIKKLKCNKSIIYPTFVISSGSLLDLKKIKEIGLFKEDYFIDFVDNEYCLRILKKGFRIAVNCNIEMKHAIGKRENKKVFKGFYIRPNFHPPLRRYYISRNSIRTTIDYFTFLPSVFLFCIRVLVHEVLSILLFESDKSKKLKAVFIGIKDGIFNNMGKCPYMFCYNKEKKENKSNGKIQNTTRKR